ncbi:hypothetical protein [Amphritea sp. HPY]|uniref:hypothetical protein n=1 Tax=Amphritea sp. HPY TaxID=3421652 RepID=UPI003D7C7D35
MSKKDLSPAKGMLKKRRSNKAMTDEESLASALELKSSSTKDQKRQPSNKRDSDICNPDLSE